MILTDKQRQIFANVATALGDCMYVIACEHGIKNPYFPKGNKGDTNLLNKSKDRANIILQDFEYDFAWCNELEQMMDGKDETEIESFIFDILAYFKNFSDEYYPYARIEDCKKIINELEMQAEHKPQDKKVYDDCIKKQNETIELLQVRAEKYEDITCKFCGEFEGMFVVLLSWVRNFSDVLDAVLMKRGIDLMKLQEEAGIYIKEKEVSIDMRAIDVSLLVGSVEIAKKYIKKLLESNESMPKAGSCQMFKEEINLPEELNTPEARRLLQKAIKTELCDENYKWHDTKALLAYLADSLSTKLELGEKLYGDRIETSWRPFAALFGVSARELIDAKKGYENNNNRKPKGYKKVDQLFS